MTIQNQNNNNGGVTLYSSTNTGTGAGTGTLASGVFLSQIPFTGAAENMRMALFVLGMILWSAFVAWIIMKKRGVKAGTNHENIFENFKRENLARKQIVA